MLNLLNKIDLVLLNHLLMMIAIMNHDYSMYIDIDHHFAFVRYSSLLKEKKRRNDEDITTTLDNLYVRIF
jgi:hypothetical protein